MEVHLPKWISDNFSIMCNESKGEEDPIGVTWVFDAWQKSIIGWAWRRRLSQELLLRHQILVERKAQVRKNVADDSSAHENCVLKTSRYFKPLYYQEIWIPPKNAKEYSRKDDSKERKNQRTTHDDGYPKGMWHAAHNYAIIVRKILRSRMDSKLCYNRAWSGRIAERRQKKKEKKSGGRKENVQSYETSLDLCHSIFSNSGSFIISINIINLLTCQQSHLLDLPFMAETLWSTQ
jgi:hypothetical protein